MFLISVTVFSKLWCHNYTNKGAWLISFLNRLYALLAARIIVRNCFLTHLWLSNNESEDFIFSQEVFRVCKLWLLSCMMNMAVTDTLVTNIAKLWYQCHFEYRVEFEDKLERTLHKPGPVDKLYSHFKVSKKVGNLWTLCVTNRHNYELGVLFACWYSALFMKHILDFWSLLLIHLNRKNLSVFEVCFLCTTPLKKRILDTSTHKYFM